MKTALATILVATFILFQSTTASAQYDMYGMGNLDQQMQQMEAYNQQMMQESDRQMQMIQQELERQNQIAQQQYQQAQRQVINEYRQKTGDNQTPDHIVLERSMQEYYRQNPQAFQQMMNDQHQSNMNAINQAGVRSKMMADSYNSMSDASMQAWRDQNVVSDRTQSNFINNTIYEQGQYVNPTTGQQATLGWNNPNQYQNQGGNQYYTDGNSNQYQWNGYNWQPMNEIR